jgi:hypothetical protein
MVYFRWTQSPTGATVRPSTAAVIANAEPTLRASTTILSPTLSLKERGKES